jgi:NADH-quinone oxidoreductase subunit N
MPAINWIALLPFLYLAACTVVLLLIVSVDVPKKIMTPLVSLFFAGGFVSLFLVPAGALGRVTDLLVVDRTALFFIGLLLAGTAAVFLLSIKYFPDQQMKANQFYLLLFLAVTGASVLSASRHFVSLFLGLELLSVPLYVMIAYPRKNKRSLESGIKYLIMAGVASAFLLFGIALVYAARGRMTFSARLGPLEEAGVMPLILAGFSLVAVGIGFKMALVPFHFWAADVYQGAPVPVAGFIATVSKAGVLALLLRLSYEAHVFDYPSIKLLFVVMAVASMFIGNWLALLQRNVKRILAYSSISHFGYILVAILASGETGAEAALFYITAYVIMTMGAFGVITALSGSKGDAEDLDAYRGLFWQSPWLGAVFTVMLLSLAGIPLTAGFIGKFYLVAAGIHSSLWIPVLALIISSVIGLYYYLRIIVAMYSNSTEKREAASLFQGRKHVFSVGVVIALFTLILLTFWFGLYPSGLIQVIKTAARSLVAAGIY